MTSLKRDIISVYTANAINGILGLGAVPLGLYMIGKTGYGLYSIYPVVYSYIILLESGFTKNLVRVLASDKDTKKRIDYLHTTFGFYICISVFLLMLLAPFLFFILKPIFNLSGPFVAGAQTITILSVIEYIIAIPTSTMLWYANADEKFDKISRFNVVSGFYRYALIYCGMIIFRTPEAVVALSASRRLVDFFTIRMIVGRLPAGAWRPSFDLQKMRSAFFHSTPLTFAQVCITSVYAAPSVLVTRFFGIEALGVYRALFDLCNRVWFFSGSMGVVVFPKFVRLFYKKNPTQIQNQQIFSALYFSWAAYILIALVGITLGPWILPVLRFQPGAYLGLFGLTLVGVCMNSHSQLCYELLQATGRDKHLVLCTLLAFFAMVAAGIGFSALGMLAIGYGWLISQFLYTTCLDFVSLSILSASWMQQLSLFLIKLAYLAAPLIAIYGRGTNEVTSLQTWFIPVILILLLQGYSILLYRKLTAHPKTYSSDTSHIF